MTIRWVVVAGGVKNAGGQDRANLELVRFLATFEDAEVHVVAHRIDADLYAWPRVTSHIVPLPFGSIFLGERLLAKRAKKVRLALGSGTSVVSNGGNCLIGDIVWVHCVHAAWPVNDQGAPTHLRWLHRLKKWDARRRELKALRNASVVVANSEKTARDLVQRTRTPARKISVVHFGSNSEIPSDRPLTRFPQLAFVGALGWDRNKGIDIALRALALLASRRTFRHRLVVAGPGSSVPWRKLARTLGVADRVDFVGMVDNIPALLSVSDVLISPSRYEAYGLAVHEALVLGVPTIVSSDAGVAERFPADLSLLRVEAKESPEAWAEAIRRVLKNLQEVRSRILPFQQLLSQRTWEQMAREFVESTQRHSAAPPG